MLDRTQIPFTNEHFAAFCLRMVGQPYWYGTCLYRCTESLRARKADQYPSAYGSSRTARYKQDIAAKKVCADCIGGAKGYAWTGGGIGVLEAIGTNNAITSKYQSNGCPDKGANSMFSYAKNKGMVWGSLSTLPDVVGLALYKKGHVGYYVGGGHAVEWKGFKDGCVKTQVAGRGWTHWYALPFIQYGDAFNGDKSHAALISVSAGDEDASQDDPLRISESEPEDGKGARRVVIVSNGGKVNIRCGNGTNYARLSQAGPGSTYDYVATAANGWHAVAIGSKVGWVSGTFSKVI